MWCRAALEKFGLEHADINFPATSYGYLEAGNYGLLQPKVSRLAYWALLALVELGMLSIARNTCTESYLFL